jgi:hypothetical protein
MFRLTTALILIAMASAIESMYFGATGDLGIFCPYVLICGRLVTCPRFPHGDLGI